jgi:hypothetical protein
MFGGQCDDDTKEMRALRSQLELTSREALEWLEPLKPRANRDLTLW